MRMFDRLVRIHSLRYDLLSLSGPMITYWILSLDAMLPLEQIVVQASCFDLARIPFCDFD